MANDSKKYLFVSFTDFASGRLTGAHRRFLELVTSVAKDSQVVYVGRKAPMLEALENVRCYEVEGKAPGFLPAHMGEGYLLYNTLRKYRKIISWDYAVSFNPVYSICYHWAGYDHIVSLFREDLIGYQEALLASTRKIAYFRMQERLAVKASEKIIVQCENDRKNLIARNIRHCPDIAAKVRIQINNANASWMKTDLLPREDGVEAPRILFVGNFSDRRKGHFFLLPAAARLLEEGYRFTLLLAGDGRELEKYRTEYVKYPNLQFLGRVNGMGQYLAKVDFMLVPSLIDSCPNTVLEGLNAGIAVYGTNTGGIPDLLQDEDYMFEPDEASLYIFLKNLLDSRRYKTDAMRQQARKESLSFDWGRMVKELIEA